MLRLTSTEQAVATGMKEVSGALGGGIRQGSLVIIEGESKSGKSVLGQHFAHGALSCEGNAVVYYTMHNTVKELIADMDSMSLDTRHDVRADRFRVYAVGSSSIFEKPKVSLQLLPKHIAKLPGRFNLVVVDCLKSLMINVDPVSKIDFFQSCKEMCEGGRSIILVADSHVLEGKTLQRAYSMSDYYMKLKSHDNVLGPGQVDERIIKILEVTKVCGAERPAQEGIKFEIKPRIGMQILPFVTVRI